MAGADGVEIATWDLGGSGPPVLLAHATGLHAWTWLGVAAVLGETHRVWALDQRGHGTSGHPPGGSYRDWSRFALDILAVVDALDLTSPAGVGHSLGGGALILAEQRRPGTFAALWCYEPIVIPPSGGAVRAGNSTLATISRRRRDRFDSRQAAFDNFAAKPPFDRLAPGVLEAYVEHGFCDDPDGGVRLALSGAEEATVYEGAPLHDAWDHLPAMRLPVTVAGSADGVEGPVALVEDLAGRIPGATVERFEGLSHFGPLEDPRRVGLAVAAALTPEGRSTGLAQEGRSTGLAPEGRSTGTVPPPR